MSLSTFDFAAVAQRRVFGMFATPDLFRPNQCPLGSGLLPRLSSLVGRTPLPKGLSLAQVRSPVRRLAPNPERPFSSSRNPQLWDEPQCLAYYRFRHDILTVNWVCSQPLYLSVEQNPLVAYLLHQDPTIGVNRRLGLWVRNLTSRRLPLTSRS
jgi:hypothetical protein